LTQKRPPESGLTFGESKHLEIEPHSDPNISGSICSAWDEKTRLLQSCRICTKKIDEFRTEIEHAGVKYVIHLDGRPEPDSFRKPEFTARANVK
jgi:hypothetical protein